MDRTELARRYEQRLKLMVPAEVKDLGGLSLFSGIPEKARDKVLEKIRKYIHWVEFARGELILKEGDYSDSAFFVAKGAVEVILEGGKSVASRTPARPRPRAAARNESMAGRPANARHTVILTGFLADLRPGGRLTLEAGEIFGETEALSRYVASASVRATEAVSLLQMRLPGLRMLMNASKEFRKFLEDRYRRRTLAAHLRSVGLFAEVDPLFVEHLKDRAELLSFEPGQVIVEEGAPADAFFLVRGGYVKVAVSAGASELAVTYLRKGDYAGEAALLVDEAWPFTLKALEHVELVKIGREDFQKLVATYPALEGELWKEMLARLKARGAVARNPISSEYVQMAMDTGLIHGESVLLIDLNTCTRCDDCVRACAATHDGTPRFIREGTKYRNWLIPAACYQCTDPVCMIDCPTGAITREVGTLEVTINEATCIGCSNCAKRCPWDNIVMVATGEKRPDGKEVELASKCDLCVTREEGPACVQMCPHGSAIRISFKDLERVTATLR